MNETVEIEPNPAVEELVVETIEDSKETLEKQR
jgi:hypothetical protein